MHAFKLRLTVCLALAGLLVAAGPSVAQGANVVPNGDFTGPCEMGEPQGWNMGNGTLVCSTQGNGDSSAMNLSNASGLQAGAGSICVNTPIPAGIHAASFSYNSVASGVTGVVFEASFWDMANCLDSGIEDVVTLSDASVTVGAYETVSGTMNVPANAASVSFALLYTCTTSCAGHSVFFDKVSFEAAALAVTMRGFSATRTAKGVAVRWRTASELDLLGFHVYRQVSGRRVRVTPRLVAARGRGSYSFLDRRAPRGRTVRYWLQAVNLDGSRSWHGPVRA